MFHENKKYYAVKIYDGSKSSYWAFLTPEATLVMDRWFEFRKSKGENLTDDSPVFTTIKNTNIKNSFLTDANARFIMYDLIKHSGLKRVKVSNTRYDKAVMYMFRKRFNTILKLDNDVNSNIAEKLMAHKKGLDGAYLQPTREECFTEFVKAVPNLTVDPTERQKVEFDKQKQEIKNLEVERDEIKRLEQSNNSLQDSIQIQKQESSDEQKRLLQILDDMQNQINNLKK